MNAGKSAGARPLARQHTIYCSPAERAELGARAEAAGMSFSRFLVECALHERDGEEADAPRLVLREDQQRTLAERVEVLDRCTRALLEHLPGMELSALGALAFLVRAAGAVPDEGGEKPR